MSTGRVYAITSNAISITGSQDLCEIAAVAGKIIKIHGWHVGAVGGTADAGDAQEELLSVSAIANATATGSGGTTITASPMNQNDTAAGWTSKANNTTKALGAATRTFFDGAWNNRVPLEFYFTPETQPSVANAQVFILRLNTAPADALAVSMTVWAEEIP